jgi:hypothetical protein
MLKSMHKTKFIVPFCVKSTGITRSTTCIKGRVVSVQTMWSCRRVKVKLCLLLTFAPNGEELSASRPGCLSLVTDLPRAPWTDGMSRSTCFGAKKVKLFLIIQPLGQSPHQLKYFDVHYLATFRVLLSGCISWPRMIVTNSLQRTVIIHLRNINRIVFEIDMKCFM